MRELEASARFYSEAFGVPLERSDRTGPRHYECSWREGSYLHFALFGAEPAMESAGGHVGFGIEDLHAAHARAVAAGAEVVEEPREEPWGRTAVYRDPDGNLVSLTEPSAASAGE